MMASHSFKEALPSTVDIVDVYGCRGDRRVLSLINICVFFFAMEKNKIKAKKGLYGVYHPPLSELYLKPMKAKHGLM